MAELSEKLCLECAVGVETLPEIGDRPLRMVPVAGPAPVCGMCRQVYLDWLRHTARLVLEEAGVEVMRGPELRDELSLRWGRRIHPSDLGLALRPCQIRPTHFRGQGTHRAIRLTELNEVLDTPGVPVVSSLTAVTEPVNGGATGANNGGREPGVGAD